MGNRDDIDEMSTGNANVLTTILKLIDRYDLYGQVAFPKHHKQSDVPDIYRLAAKTKVSLVVNCNVDLILFSLMFFCLQVRGYYAGSFYKSSIG